MGTKSMMVYKRRLKVKKMYLQGTAISDIASQLNTSVVTIKNDIKEINKTYIAAVQKNGNILEKQAEYILKHLDQLNMVKRKLWELEEIAASDKDRISALKAVLEELNHEARILKLIELSKTINNYIHIDKINNLTQSVIEVNREFVPLDQQKYALERLKQAGKKIIDVKSKDTHGK